MPIYCYRREDGAVLEELFPIGKAPRLITCGDGKLAWRSLTDETRSAEVCRGPGHFPWESDSMGVNPDQIPEMQREFPEHKFNPKTGAMIFENVSHMDRCLKDLRVDQYSPDHAVTRLASKP